jgi:hypothetical protein
MGLWPFDKIDGGAPCGTQGGGKPSRGLKAKRARAAGVVVEKPTPQSWLNLAASLPNAPQQPEENADKRGKFRKKYGVDVESRRAHMTPEIFGELANSTRKLRTLGEYVDVIEINDGFGLRAQFDFAQKSHMMEPEAPVSDQLPLSHIVKNGVSSALKGSGVALLTDPSSRILYGTLRKIDLAADLAAHKTQQATLHRGDKNLKLDAPSSFRGAFNSYGNIANVIKKIQDNPDGAVLNLRYRNSTGDHYVGYFPVAQIIHPDHEKKLTREFNLINLTDFRDRFVPFYLPGADNQIAAKKKNDSRVRKMFADGKGLKINHLGKTVALLVPPKSGSAAPSQPPDPSVL